MWLQEIYKFANYISKLLDFLCVMSVELCSLISIVWGKKSGTQWFSVMSEELCKQQYRGELKQVSEGKAQEKQKMRRNQPQTNCRSSTLDSDEGCKAAGCTQKSLSNTRGLPTMQESWLLPGEHNWDISKVTKMLEMHLKKQRELVRGGLETQPAWCESRGVKRSNFKVREHF